MLNMKRRYIISGCAIAVVTMANMVTNSVQLPPEPEPTKTVPTSSTKQTQKEPSKQPTMTTTEPATEERTDSGIYDMTAPMPTVATAPAPTPPAVVATITKPNPSEPSPVKPEPIADVPQTPLIAEHNSIKGWWYVNNKTQALIEAGIPKDQWEALSAIIDSTTHWRYKAVNELTSICFSQSLTRIAGDFVADDPIVQLKACHKAIIDQYGSWQSALEVYNLTGKY